MGTSPPMHDEEELEEDREPLYDDEGRLCIHCAPWKRQDFAVAGKVHCEIYVWGRLYPAPAHNSPHMDATFFDSAVRFDVGVFNLYEPPTKRPFKVRGQWVNPQHDGHCEFIRHRVLTQVNAERLDGALDQMLQSLLQAIESAKLRPKEFRYDEQGKEIMVHVAYICLECENGRNRSVIMANEAAQFLAKHGFTRTITYWSLWSGVVEHYSGRPDDRGPCGCHYGPEHCQIGPGSCSAAGQDMWCALWRELQEINREAFDRKFTAWEAQAANAHRLRRAKMLLLPEKKSFRAAAGYCRKRKMSSISMSETVQSVARQGYWEEPGSTSETCFSASGPWKPRIPSVVRDQRFSAVRAQREVICDACEMLFVGNDQGNFVFADIAPALPDRESRYLSGDWNATWLCVSCNSIPGEDENEALERIFPGRTARNEAKRRYGFQH